MLHEAEAQLDARDAIGNRRNHHSIFVRHSRRFRRGHGDEQHTFVQDVVTSDVVRERQRHTLGHAAEYDRRARDAKRRVAVEVFDELFRRFANFEAKRVHDLLALAPSEHDECDDEGDEQREPAAVIGSTIPSLSMAPNVSGTARKKITPPHLRFFFRKRTESDLTSNEIGRHAPRPSRHLTEIHWNWGSSATSSD